MRIVSFLIFVCLFESCVSQNNNDTFIPREYQYPEDSILNGKTFIYKKLGTPAKNYIDFNLRRVGNKKYRITVQYLADETEDSAITLNDKTKEIYSFSFDNGKPLKGLVVQDTIINNGTKFGKRIKRTIFKANDYTSDNISEVEYSKDTIFIWQKRKIDCIVMKGISTTQLISNSDSSRQELTSYQNLYFGKGIGLIQYSLSYNNEHNVFKLTNICDKK